MAITIDPRYRSGRRVAAAVAMLTAVLVGACGTSVSPSPSGAVATPPLSPAVSETPTDAPLASPSQAAITYPATIVDAFGRSHAFDGPVTKVGCMLVLCDETLADLGVVPYATIEVGDAENKLRYPNGVPANTEVPWGEAEPWAALETDIIVYPANSQADLIGFDELLGNLFYLYWPPSEAAHPGVDAWEENLRMLETATGTAGAAQAAIDRYHGFIEDVRAVAPDEAADTGIMFFRDRLDPAYAVWQPTIIGCVELARAELGECLSPEVVTPDLFRADANAEAVLALDPQYIGRINPDFTDADWQDRTDPVWSQLTAVKEGRAFTLAVEPQCCSLRSLQYFLHRTVFATWGEAAGLPDPGAPASYDPWSAAEQIAALQ